MATTPSKKAKKGGGKRVYLAVGLVALVVIGYLWYRGRSSSSLAASPSGASAAPAGSPAASGDSSGAATPDLSSLLGALQGENQSLLDAFVKGESGLVSLASQFGAPRTTTAAPPVADQSPPPAVPAPAPSPAAAAPSSFGFSVAGIPVTGVSEPVAGFDQYPILDLSNVQVAPSPSYESLPQEPIPVAAPASGAPGSYPTLDLSSIGGNQYPVSSTSGAGGVQSGATKVNYQAKARAA